jgi:sec-independent protein translocase protein TatC
MGAERGGTDLDFFAHLEDLRRRLVAAFAVLILASAAAFSRMDSLIPFLTGPAARAGIRLYAMAPFEKFAAYLKASVLAGATLALPVAAALLAAFVAPALKSASRRLLAPGIAAVCLFVLSGVALAWFAMVPFAIGFFARFASSDGIEPLWSLGSYISLVAGLVAATAIVCLIPPLLLGFIKAGILRTSTLAKGRRYAIVAIAAIAGIVTPTVDVVSQVVVGAAMWGLFELTLLIGRLIESGRARREAPKGGLVGQA